MAVQAQKNEVVQKAKTDVDITVNNPFIDTLSAQLNEKQKYGLTFPPDYNPTNALNGAYLVLKDLVDNNKKPVLSSCTQASIANALMDMVTLGLNVQKNQAYFIPYGGKLRLQTSYHGNKTIAHRCGVKTINAEVIYEGDSFKYHMEKGRKVLDEHIQDFMNVDLTKIKGAYAVLELADGSTYVEVMNFVQIETAWKKGFGYKKGAGTHGEFADMMAKKTVVNRACKNFIQQYGDNYVTTSYDNVEDAEAEDKTAIDVKYNIETNANTEEFIDAEDFEVEDIADAAETAVEKGKSPF